MGSSKGMDYPEKGNKRPLFHRGTFTHETKFLHIIAKNARIGE